ncbi:hypothetical protein AKJ66_00440 [candidate division MSBL1 archaeon SCGC-AAA259E22]|uniref:DNA/RNA-binding protein Alba-like domain-containing protein n=1 Tax=candidate division MSBL1 archaeon SCGC-AAA259E22 TaxID=1698265 RepID=A0A133UI45_9EURY|nr:hypothetical protein AKJ66_00440 [candidate division MSBL1 archaeon SCGC-AAA259E22]
MVKEIRIGKKSKGSYVSAVLYAFNHGKNPVIVAGLGGQVPKTFDVAEIIGNMLDKVDSVDTEVFEKDNLQGVRITLAKEGQNG